MLKYLTTLLIVLFLVISSTGSAAAVDMKQYGIIDIKNHTISGIPRAKGDGVTDDSDAIQKVMEYAFENRYAVVFPSGTYLVSKTILLYDDTRWPDSRNHSFIMIGSTKGSRPVFKLKDNSPGFNNPGDPKSVIKIIRMCDGKEDRESDSCLGSKDNEGHAANHFNEGIRNIDIKIGKGNPGAAGIYLNGHQDNFMEDMYIDLTESGTIGIHAAPGMASTTGNLTVVGGDYGIYGDNLRNTTFNNITLLNQRKAAIYNRSWFMVTLVGFKIVKDQAPVIETGGINRGMTLVDGTIEVKNNSNTPAIRLHYSDGKYTNGMGGVSSLTNVYLKNANIILKSSTDELKGGSGWYKVDGYYTDSVDGKGETYSVIEKNKIADGYDMGTSKYNSEPDDYRKYHMLPALHSADVLVELGENQEQSRVCNAVKNGVNNNRERDAQPILQQLIYSGKCEYIFLPKGYYFFGRTLILGKDTKLIGLTSPFTKIKASSAQYDLKEWRPTSEVPLITTVDDANATTVIADMHISVNTRPKEHDWIVGLHWRAGKNSVIKNVMNNMGYSTESQTNPKPEIKFSGNGGGKWFAAGSKGVPTDARASTYHRKLLITGTSQPLQIYSLNIEDGEECLSQGTSTCQEDAWQAEITNSRNIAIYGAKFENYRGLRIKDSDNIGYFGNNVDNQLGAWNNTNVLFASLSVGGRKANYNADIRDGSFKTIIGEHEWLSVYKKGTLDMSKIRSGGAGPGPTAVPTPTEAAPTPTEEPTVAPSPSQKPTQTGDFDNSGCVNIIDFGILIGSFNLSPGEPNYNAKVNLDSKPIINIFDFQIFIQNFGKGCS